MEHSMASTREARLRPDAAHLYPDLPTGRWLEASRLAQLAATDTVEQSPHSEGRALNDRHFEFRHGDNGSARRGPPPRPAGDPAGRGEGDAGAGRGAEGKKGGGLRAIGLGLITGAAD